MTVEADIKTALAALVAPGSVYPDLAPIDAPRPYITYQQVGGVPVVFLEHAMPSKKNGSYQINVWAENRAAAKALILQVESAMVLATAFQADAKSGVIDTYEPDTKLYGSQQDFSVWSDR